MYKQGLGTKQDYQEAIKWYKLAANQDNAKAQYNLGYIYQHGLGTEKDYQKAFKWYKLHSAGKKRTRGFETFLDKKYVINKLTLSLIVKTKKEEKIIEKKKQLAEHLNLYPGTNLEQAEKDFYLLTL